MKRAIPFVLVVTGCEMDDDLAATQRSLCDQLKDFSFDRIVCGTTLSGGTMASYLSEIRATMKAELWPCIEQFCKSSSINIPDIPNDSPSEEQNNPLWWRIIETLYQYLVAGNEKGVSIFAEYVYVTPTQDGRGVHVTDTQHNERDN